MHETGFKKLAEDPEHGEYVVIETLYGELEEPVSTAWLDRTDCGRRLSDEWVGETVEDMAESTNADERDLAVQLEDAFLRGDLRKEIVVAREGAGDVAADDSLSDVGFAVDDVDVTNLGDRE